MSSRFPHPCRMFLDAQDLQFERPIERAEDLCDLDGETMFRRRRGMIGADALDALGRDLW